MRPFPDMSAVKTPEDLRILKDLYDALRNWRPKIRMMVRGTRIGTVTVRPFGDLPEVQGAGPPGCVPPLERLTPARRAIIEMTRDIARTNREIAWREAHPEDLSQYATDVSGNPMPQWQANAPSFDDEPMESTPAPTVLPDDPDEAVEGMMRLSGMGARLEAEREEREALRDLVATLAKPVRLPEFEPFDYLAGVAQQLLPATLAVANRGEGKASGPQEPEPPKGDITATPKAAPGFGWASLNPISSASAQTVPPAETPTEAERPEDVEPAAPSFRQNNRCCWKESKTSSMDDCGSSTQTTLTSPRRRGRPPERRRNGTKHSKARFAPSRRAKRATEHLL